MPTRISCIVEGHGEVEALPILIRRIAAALDPPAYPQIARPIRIPRDTLLRGSEFERGIQLAASTAGAGGGIIVLLDADDACPAETGPELLARAKATRPDMPSVVVLAKKEYESWFLAGAQSLRGQRGLPVDLNGPDDPEETRGAKEWLRRHMPRGLTYRETLDQPAFTAQVDLELAMKAPSFAKFRQDVSWLCEELRHHGE